MHPIRGAAEYRALIRFRADRLQKTGLVVPKYILEHAVGSHGLNPDGIKHEGDPITRLLIWLSSDGRIDFLAEEAWIHPHVIKTLGCMAMQWKFPTVRISPQYLELTSLAARRHILGIAHRPETVTVGEQFAFYETDLLLPHPDSNPGSVRFDHHMPDHIRTARRQAGRLLRGAPMDGSLSLAQSSNNVDFEEAASAAHSDIFYAARGGSLEVVEKPRRTARLFSAETATTSAMAYATPLEFPALRLLQDAVHPNFQTQKTRPFIFIFLLQLFHGIPHRDVEYLGLKENGPLGRITRDHLILRIGGPYYQQAGECYESSELSLPLAGEIQALLKSYGEDVFQKPLLGAGLGKHHLQGYQMWVRSFLWKVFPGVNANSQAFHRVWQKIAVLDLEIHPTIVGLLRANPLPLTRGPSAYVSAATEELVDAQTRIHQRIREGAGLPNPKIEILSQKVSSPTPIRHGTPGPTYAEYLERLHSHIDGITTRNEACACVEGFIRAFGLRNLRNPLNPVLFYSSIPLPSFEFSDKIVGRTGRSRWIPISEEIARFLQVCRRVLGLYRFLPFVENGLPKPLTELSASISLRKIISWPGFKQPGRTAFFNMLRGEGAGEALINYLMGRGAAMWQQLSHLSPLSLDAQVRQAQEFLLPLYTKYRIDEIAILLGNRLSRYIDPTIGENKIGEPEERAPHQRLGELEGEPFESGIRTLSTAEKYYNLLLNRRSHISKEDARVKRERGDCLGGIGLNKSTLATLITLDIGVPIENLHRFRRYYTTHNFIEDLTTGDIYFIALGEHSDVGGLFTIPLPVCTRNEKDQNRVYSLFLRLFKESSHSPFRLFPEERWIPRIGRSFKHLILQKAPRCYLSERECHQLLTRLSRFACRRKYPGSVLFGLAWGGRYGLNHVAIEDVIELRTGSIPHLVFAQNGLPYQNKLAFGSSELERSRATIKRIIAVLPKSLESASPLPEIRLILKSERVIPSIASFKRLLLGLGFSTKRASGFARGLMKYCRDEGLLRLSQPLRFLGRHDHAALLRAFGEHSSWRSDPHQLFIALATYGSGLRIGELSDKSQFHLFSGNGRHFIYIGNGKTPNAQRWIDLDLNAVSNEAIRAIRDTVRALAESNPPTASSPFSASFAHVPFNYPEKVDTAANRIEQMLKELSSKKLTPHGLRHLFLLHSMRRAFDERLHSGNFQSFCCHLATAAGHGSVAVLIRDYIGTAIISLQVPPFPKLTPASSAPVSETLDRELSEGSFREDPLQESLFRLHFASSREAENQLRFELGGEAAYVSQLKSTSRTLLSMLAVNVNFGRNVPLTVTLAASESDLKQAPAVLDRFDCLLSKPMPGRERIWEQEALILVERALKLKWPVLLPLYSDRPAFRNKLLRLAGRYHAKIVNSDGSPVKSSTKRQTAGSSPSA